MSSGQYPRLSDSWRWLAVFYQTKIHRPGNRTSSKNTQTWQRCFHSQLQMCFPVFLATTLLLHFSLRSHRQEACSTIPQPTPYPCSVPFTLKAYKSTLHLTWETEEIEEKVKGISCTQKLNFYKSHKEISKENPSQTPSRKDEWNKNAN